MQHLTCIAAHGKLFIHLLQTRQAPHHGLIILTLDHLQDLTWIIHSVLDALCATDAF